MEAGGNTPTTTTVQNDAGAVCSSETPDGGEDVFSSKNSDADHLVVMVNGILGSAADWKFAAEQFVRVLPDKVFVHSLRLDTVLFPILLFGLLLLVGFCLSYLMDSLRKENNERNSSKLTLDGVDVMGERLAEEVLDVIKRKPNLRKISFIAHSVGGLVARYAIGRLYRPHTENAEHLSVNASEESMGTIGGLVPMNFIAVATPHLGSRGNRQVPFLFGVSALERTAVLVIHWIFRRTGRHLFLTDDDEGKPPLLKRMLEDQGECHFMSALRSFKRRVAYANVGYDHIVGWRTSSIRRNSELPKWEECVNEKYPHIVYEERCKAFDGEQSDTKGDDSNDVEAELVTGLSRVSWEKVDVSFRASKLRFAAHSLIQVKDHSMQTEGADVIQHMIDHFHL